MATTNIPLKENNKYVQLLRFHLTSLERAMSLNDDLACMVHMVDGDGSSPAHFTEMTERYEMESNEDAKALWDELQSVMAKLNTDASVDNVNAAIEQIIAKLR